MELIKEDGTGLTNANTYAEVIDADLYFSGHPDEETWTAATDDRKAWAIYRAARYLEARYSGRWRGSPAEYGQGLSWPRAIFTPSGWLWGTGLIDQWEIPPQLIEAQCELALRDIKSGLTPDVQRSTFASSQSIGPLSITYEQSAPSGARFPEIDVILAPLLSTNSMSIPIVRG